MPQSGSSRSLSGSLALAVLVLASLTLLRLFARVRGEGLEGPGT
jgi:hypothetical protein